jgi:hypothetical protein
MRGAPLFRATADSHNGRLRKARGSTLRSPATAERLRRSFAATWDRKKLHNLSTKRLSKAFKNSDRGVFQPSLQTTHISAVNLCIDREDFLGKTPSNPQTAEISSN